MLRQGIVFSYKYVLVSKSIYELGMSLHKNFKPYSYKEASNIIYQKVIGCAYDRYLTEFYIP